jgi:hypothetical protein
MGVRDELIPQDFGEAARFYAQVKKRQAGASAQGRKLTRSLGGFLQDYLPGWMKQDLPMMLIATQLTAEECAMIRPEDTRTPPWWMRLLVWTGFKGLGLYYFAKTLLVRRFPPLKLALGRSFAIAGEALIDSWRDGYQRRPFWIPGSVNGGWQREAGMDEAMQERLRAWRRTLFSTVILGVTCVVLAALLTLAGFIAIPFILDLPAWVWALLPCSVLICWISAFSILTWRVKRVVAKRPGPQAPGNHG